jgi:iron complex transport system permease protein
MNPTSRRTWSFVVCCTALSLLAAVIVSTSVGTVTVPFIKILRIVATQILPLDIQPDWSAAESQIIWQFRLPRVLLSAVVGAALAVSGATLQTIVRNPLADPFIFGVSYGASTGAVLVLTLGAALAGTAFLSIAAFIGALLTTAFVYALAQHNGQTSSLRLLLAGAALSHVLSAATSALVLLNAMPGNSGAATVLAWLAGSLSSAKWTMLGTPTLLVIICTTWLTLRSRALNAMLIGEESAISLGIDVQRLRIEMFIISSILVGTVVAISGAIGFVGLMIPHVTRMLTGPDHRRLMPFAMIAGALFLVITDLLSRVLLAPQELPVGIVTSLIGGPFFLWLLRQHLRGEKG